MHALASKDLMLCRLKGVQSARRTEWRKTDTELYIVRVSAIDPYATASVASSSLILDETKGEMRAYRCVASWQRRILGGTREANSKSTRGSSSS